jgi:hypothetical protein
MQAVRFIGVTPPRNDLLTAPEQQVVRRQPIPLLALVDLPVGRK